MLPEVKIPYILRACEWYMDVWSRFFGDAQLNRALCTIVFLVARPVKLIALCTYDSSPMPFTRYTRTKRENNNDCARRRETKGKRRWIKYCFWTIEMDRLLATTEINYQSLKIVEVAVIEGIRVYFHQASLILENINGFDIVWIIRCTVWNARNNTFWI